ncbi:MAG: Tyrosine-tRNA ligase [Candidatus Gottesmanbacteria bacterium GW2011_GWB1_44_11c]|uniref:Tyrosine--tRNA ligase n=1 Tax=Candidatus Gottesmanbacteria bacterium GW2011_GWB1_44_11c TaxID=1618447 RepID=A0A0G1JLK4_9BACT|nr:MAG: Tyrosine-tRNA ligase [Candidatus Gottesmanbacteria bacterium GW2011_GWB1_44_11c]
MDTVEELLTRGIENIIPNKEKLRELLAGGKKLNIYLGIDPTATTIHLGHAVPLRKLQKFAELGHHVTFLIGDFTALIGDTSDKDSERPQLTSKQIEQNFQTYKSQAEKLLDFSKITVRHNSEWLSKLSYAKIIEIMQHFSAGDFFNRELIRKRLSESKHVGLHEIMYPVMQGYDSYFMDTDIQLGGTDQTFNMQAGRILQKDLRNKESFIIANGFLTGTDGRKMSKTWNNAIWLTDKPNDMFGKIMSIQDTLLEEYFLLATNVPIGKIEEVKKRLSDGENPMVLKKELARTIVKELHGEEQANEAQQSFEATFQKQKEPSKDMVTIFHTDKDTVDIVSVLVESGLCKSHSEARRLIVQKGIDEESICMDNTIVKVENDRIYKIGKKRFLKIQKGAI